MNRLHVLLILILTHSLSLEAQNVFDFQILWSDTATVIGMGDKRAEVPTFKGASHAFDNGFVPIYVGTIELGRGQKAQNVTIEVTGTGAFDRKKATMVSAAQEFEPGAFVWHEAENRGKNVVIFEYLPILLGSRGYERVESFKVNVVKGAALRSGARASFTTNSVLSNGEWYRIGVVSDGVHRIDRNTLSALGIDVDALTPQSINIYGNGYGQLPFENDVPRPDDLLLNSIHVEGENDGSFDEGDFILFYAKGPDKWSYNESSGLFDPKKHDYSDTSYYFIGINTGAPPSRIGNLNSSGSGANFVSTSFDAYTFHEVDRENVLKSGREWYGEKFDVQTTYNFSGGQYTFPNIVDGSTTTVRADVLSRSTVDSTDFTLNVNNSATDLEALPRVGTAVTSLFAREGQLLVEAQNVPQGLNINISFNKRNVASAVGWLNRLVVNTRRALRMSGSQMQFRDIESVAPGRITRFELQNAGSVQEVWEVTEPHSPRRIQITRSGNNASFTLSTDQLREFAAFSGATFFTPIPAGRVENQNLHALGTDQRVDMVIVTPSGLAQRAEELAEIHRNYEADPLNVEVVSIQKIYNEFSSGMRDITAIKWMMKMLYDRAGGNEDMMPRYLLLFGDGSFDNRNTTPGNSNLIPTFQSINSLSPANSYVSDDYFGLLGDNEGESQLDQMDIAVGRLTVKNNAEATSVVNKIRRYVEAQGNTGANCSICNGSDGGFGPWRNIIALVADDQDGNSHMRNSNTVAELINGETRGYNLERIFIDAFQQIATPGGSRYPDANRAIDRRVRNGAFIVNYIGHGGTTGWAQERILDVPTILEWDNTFAMPVFMTATCEFTRFDDPLRTSAGEYVLLNGNGGGIALMTTTRLVYAGPNFDLTENFYESLFDRPDEETVARLGDVSRECKNRSVSSGSSNHRNFSLIGDPALPLAIPRHSVSITSITDTLGTPVDTLKALAVVRVAGEVRNLGGGLLSNYNGILNATVYDREKDVLSLANDAGTSPFAFRQQEDIVYRGNAEVKNGIFQFDFVLPKDISFAVDSTARISLYVQNEDEDGRGFINELKIGDRDPNAVDDGMGPEVNLFLNDENFVFGGFTDDTPVLIATVFDNSGINTVGTGVGHDITATLDDDPSKSVVLNDFYESDLNTFRSGRINYQFDKLEPGNHELTLKIWNVHNRSSEEKTAFIVADSEEFAIERVLNYPNPFTTKTEFFFEHNQSCDFLNVMIQVFTVSGKLVKSIVTVSNTDGFRNEPIPWNGRDDYGDRLATGVYVYKVSVRNPAGDQVEQYEKLVILN